MSVSRVDPLRWSNSKSTECPHKDFDCFLSMPRLNILHKMTEASVTWFYAIDNACLFTA